MEALGGGGDLDVGADRSGGGCRRRGHETMTAGARWAPRQGRGRPPSCSSRQRSGLSCNLSGCRIRSLPCRRASRASCTPRSRSSPRRQWRTPSSNSTGGVNYHSTTMTTTSRGVDRLDGHPPGAGVVFGGRGAVVIWGRRRGGGGLQGGLLGALRSSISTSCRCVRARRTSLLDTKT